MNYSTDDKPDTGYTAEDDQVDPFIRAKCGHLSTMEELDSEGFCANCATARNPEHVGDLESNETGEPNGKEYWITPPAVYAALDREFNFDCDPCPYPHKNGFDGTEIEWGKSSYVNPPFRKRDSKYGKGPTAFVRKAIEENKKGKTVVIMLNTNAFINMLIEAGAEMRSMGRLKWLSGKTGKPWPSPSNTTCFILKGKPVS